MKINRIQKRAAMAASIACIVLAGVASAASSDNTQEKIRLMVTAVQARDSGNFQASKQALEELVKLAPNDESVQRMLADVNADIERQAKGEKPVLANEAAVAKLEAEKQAKAEEAKAEDGEKADESIVAEANRKLQLSILASFDLIDAAYDAMDSGDWDDASAKLALAEEKIASHEYSPAADEVRSELKRAKATMAKERANIAMAERDVKGAKKFASDYAASEENSDKAKNFVAEVDAFEDNPYNNRISDASPDYSVRMKRVEVLLEKGRRQYLYGDYSGARSTFRQIETLDANNIQAKAYQRLIAEKLANPGKLSYLATRESMLDEVNQGWVRPQVYSGTSIDMGGTRTDSVVDAKLRNIIIPNVSFPSPGVPLAEAIGTLSKLSVDYDKSADAKKGVNVVLYDAAGESKDINIVLDLRDRPLGQILKVITQMAGYQYDVEDDIIAVRKGATSAMDTLDFPITSAAVTRMVGIKAAGSAGSDDPFGGGGAGGGDDNAKGDAIKQFLIKAGVEFGQGASMAYDGTKLWVTNTRRNLDKVRNILLRYSEIKQVEIEAKFMEVTQGDLKELGFNWNVGQIAGAKNSLMKSNNRSLADSAQSTNAGKTPITIKETSASEPEEVYNSIAKLPSTINLGPDASEYNTSSVDLGAIGSTGILDSYIFNMTVRALEQKSGSDLLCAPKVTVLSGSQAIITVSQQMRYPESWGDMQSNVGTSSGTGTAGGAAGVTVTPGTPTDFTSYDVGVVMEVTPNVEEDGSINLILNPKVTEFEGFLEYGGVAVAMSSGTTVTVPSGFIQPVFSVREIRTSVTVFDGATLVMGGLTREQVITVNDQVPVLGDIPWVGRLFQSKGETRQKRNLLIFVTVNRISPGGSVGREQFQEMRPGSVFQNPMIVSPGGAVQRVLETENASAEK